MKIVWISYEITFGWRLRQSLTNSIILRPIPMIWCPHAEIPLGWRLVVFQPLGTRSWDLATIWWKRNTSPAFEWSSRWKLLWCWPGFGLALLLDLHVIRLFDPKKNICFGFLKGRGCVESKNKTSAKRKSTMSSLDPSIIQVASFKCRADVPLCWLLIYTSILDGLTAVKC